MGIRYYAYAFDVDLTEQAARAPHSILSCDPLADAWGMEPGVRVGVATFEQTARATPRSGTTGSLTPNVIDAERYMVQP